jgi:cytoskeletal protein CcmA (bactofilin family)
MKYSWIVTAIAATLISNTSLALEKCASSMGNVTINQVTLGCMSINGTAALNGTTFTGDLLLTGPLKATGVKFIGLNVKGPVNLDSCQVAGAAHIIGSLSALSSIFQQKLTVISDNVLFSDATAQDIVIDSNKPSTVILNNSTVNGNITFHNSHGTVTINKSTVKGKIIQPAN